MNNKKIIFLLFAAFLISSPILAQDNPDDMMKIWMDYMTPGPVHQAMAKMVGDWKIENKMWMQPGAEPTVSEGTCKIESLLGDRYFKTSYQGNVMNMPFEGFYLEGYDNGLKQFNSIWVDNFGTGMMILKGTYDDATKSVNYKGLMYDPMQKKEISVREVIKIIDENKFVSEMYVQSGDSEYLNMQITHTRTK